VENVCARKTYYPGNAGCGKNFADRAIPTPKG
jgi:hypothetical protein